METKLLTELSTTARETFRVMESAPKRCPVCAVMRTAAERFIDAHVTVLDDNVHDAMTRSDIRAQLGFCSEHARMVLARRQGLIPALMYRDVISRLRVLLRDFESLPPSPSPTSLSERVRLGARAKDHPSREADCGACRCEHEVEAHAVRAVLEGMDSPHFRARYVHTHGVCFPHFEMAHTICRDPEQWRIMYHTQVAGLDELLGELNELIRKQDYRFSHEGIGPEADSCRRAVERVRGRK